MQMSHFPLWATVWKLQSLGRSSVSGSWWAQERQAGCFSWAEKDLSMISVTNLAHCEQSQQLFEESLHSLIQSHPEEDNSSPTDFTEGAEPSSLWRVGGYPWIRTWGLPAQQPLTPLHYTQIIARKVLCSTTLTYPIQLCASFLSTH